MIEVRFAGWMGPHYKDKSAKDARGSGHCWAGGC